MATRISGRARNYRTFLAESRRKRGKWAPRFKSVQDAARNVPAEGEMLSLARRIYALRRHRDQCFGGDLFSEPAWDILLRLYVEAGDGRDLSISTACEGAAAPATTALRKLRQLEEGGWILREGDSEDARRSFVRLSPQALEQMRDLLKGACSRHDDRS